NFHVEVLAILKEPKSDSVYWLGRAD
ncbi:hypothetical protein NPIL_523711, partial [Nephila pilipes]